MKDYLVILSYLFVGNAIGIFGLLLSTPTSPSWTMVKVYLSLAVVSFFTSRLIGRDK
jgi:hypothetical protein